MRMKNFLFLNALRLCEGQASKVPTLSSKVLRIHRGSKDFFFVLLGFCMASYFYVWWDLEGGIWAADGRWGETKDRFVGEGSARGWGKEGFLTFLGEEWGKRGKLERNLRFAMGVR